jgi:hypothetical protein
MLYCIQYRYSTVLFFTREVSCTDMAISALCIVHLRTLKPRVTPRVQHPNICYITHGALCIETVIRIEPKYIYRKVNYKNQVFLLAPQKYITRLTLWHVFYLVILHSKGENWVERFGIKIFIWSFWLLSVYSRQLNAFSHLM